MRIKENIRFLLLIVLLIIAGKLLPPIIHQRLDSTPTPFSAHKIILETSSSIEYLWEKDIVTYSRTSKIIGSNQGILYFLGAMPYVEEQKLFAINGETGEILWEKSPKDGRTPEFYVGSQLVYLGMGSTVIAYDPETGNQVWEKQLIHSRNIVYLYEVDNILYVSATSSVFYKLEPITGEIIEFDREAYIFDMIPDWLLIRRPAFLPDKVYFWKNRNMDLASPIAYLNRSELSSTILDNTHLVASIGNHAISNVALTSTKGYVITADDQLVIFDLDSGNKIEDISINPPFDFYGMNYEVQHKGYHLSIDQLSNKLYIVLGDSNQLFAFKILLEP